MAKSLKEKGVEELKVFQTRARRQHQLHRIGARDLAFLEHQTNLLIDRIEKMDEIDDNFAPEIK